MLRCQCPSVRPSVCDVCALWSQGAMDPGYLCMLGQTDVFTSLLTDNASPGSSDGMMPGFLVEEGRCHLAARAVLATARPSF